jgi:hypothetical protein
MLKEPSETVGVSLMWGPPPRPDLRKYFRRVTLHQITDNYEPNGKSYTIGKLRLRDNGPGGFRGLVVYYITATQPDRR